jgi:3-hydroxyisobutyrate dehydrogenase/2-hydroxy-3-oxopropionate reductase
MGYPMAANLRKAGHEVAVWSKTKAKAEKLAADSGAVACSTPKEAAEKSEIVFLCVGDTQMSEETILGPEGIVEGASEGDIVVDTSTISASHSVRIGEKLAEKGVEFLGAPCTGSKPGAENATLTFMVGGDRAIYDRVMPYFQAMGTQFYYCGGPGMGLRAKLSQNLILSNVLQAFNEGIVLAVKAGVDPELMLDILDNSAAKSGVISFKAPMVFQRDFSTNFSIKWMHKDIGLMLDSADELDVPLPLTATTQQMFRAAISMGYGEEDICASVKVLEEITGVTVKKS